MSLAITVWLPTVLRVTLRFFVPATSSAGEGKMAFGSDELILTKSETVFTKFQYASTAFTVTLNAAPAVWALGVPTLPVALPGAADSPGASTCSFANVAAFTVTAELVPGVLPGFVTSDAVTVELPAVFNVTLNVAVPA